MSTKVDRLEWLRTPWGWYTGRDDLTPPYGALTIGGKRLAVLTNGIALVAVYTDDAMIPALDDSAKPTKQIREIIAHRGEGDTTVELVELQRWAGAFQPRFIPCDCGDKGCDECEGECVVTNEAAYRYGFVLGVPLNQNVLAEVVQYFMSPTQVRLTSGRNTGNPMLIVDGPGEWRAVVMGCRIMTEDPLSRQPPVEQWPRFAEVQR